MSQDKNEQEPEKVVVINDAPTALTANMAAASKLAGRLRAAGANLPQEVWQAIEDGRTQDFQNHPDFMAATTLWSSKVLHCF
jgi:ABC-type sugar transport system substrate-binding protein